MEKRDFIKNITLGAFALPFSFEKILAAGSSKSAHALAADDDFWVSMRASYHVKPDYINLENGYYNFLPHATLEEFIRQIRILNSEGSYYQRTKMADDKIVVRSKIAEFVGCSLKEIIITRNTTESMDTVISGFDWKAGDEAIMAEQDYGAMLDMFRQQARRYGMVNKIISVPNHPQSDEEIVTLYEKAITRNARLLMVCHMINITGQILPIRKICDMAHRYGVKVLVDGAHAVGHFDFNIADLSCDFYASSLHKWLSVPLGAGLLYVAEKNIEELWPLFGDQGYAATDIRKLNHTGTHPMFTELTIPYAIKFYQQIGAERKEARLRYLKDYWVNKVKDIPGIKIYTPHARGRSCGIANVGLEKILPSDMARQLLDVYKIWTVAIDYAGVKGCRITPNVYTSTLELDQLVRALTEMAKA